MANCSLSAFHTEVEKLSARALKTPVIQAIQIDGLEIHLRFADRGFCDRMMPALSHLACKPSKPLLQIAVWDTAHTGLKLPPPPWEEDRYLPRGDIEGFNAQGCSIAFQLSSGCLSVLDETQKNAIFWVSDYEKLPYWEYAAPLRLIFQWWLKEKGMTLVHAAAVATSDGGVLLPGKGGEGKSTTALNAWKNGLSYLSDDYCLISAGEKPRVHSLYCFAKMRRNHRLSEVELCEWLPGSEKALFFVRDRLLNSSVLTAIVLPKIIQSQKESKLKPCSKIEAIKALAPSTMYQLAGADQATFQGIVDLVKRLPCFFLELGCDTVSPSNCIKEIIANESQRCYSGL